MSPGFPTEPVEAAARRAIDGRADPDLVLLAMIDNLIEVAVDDDGAVIIAGCPGQCVLRAGRHHDRPPGTSGELSVWRQGSCSE